MGAPGLLPRRFGPPPKLDASKSKRTVIELALAAPSFVADGDVGESCWDDVHARPTSAQQVTRSESQCHRRGPSASSAPAEARPGGPCVIGDALFGRAGRVQMDVELVSFVARHSAYDAVYVAPAEAIEAPIVTCDSPLAEASGHRARIE